MIIKCDRKCEERQPKHYATPMQILSGCNIKCMTTILGIKFCSICEADTPEQLSSTRH